MTEKENLELIRNMIDRTKGNLRAQSGYYLIWGWLVLLATLSEYVLIQFMPEFVHHYIVWPVVVLIGVGATIYLSAKQKKDRRVTTYADRALVYFWSSWGFVLFLLLFYTIFGGLDWGNSYAFIIALYGMGATVSGGILKFKALVYGGVFSSAIAAFTLFTGISNDFEAMLLFLALSVASSYLIPGYQLRRS